VIFICVSLLIRSISLLMSLWGAKVSSDKPFVLERDEFVGTGIYNAALLSSSGSSVHLYLHTENDKFLVGTFRPGSVEQFPLTVEISPDDDNTYQFSVEPSGSEVHLTGALILPEMSGFPPGGFDSDEDDLIGLQEVDDDDDDDEDEGANIVDVTHEETKPKLGKLTQIKITQEDKLQDTKLAVEKPKEGMEKKPKTKPPAQSGQPSAVKTDQSASEGDGKKGKKRPAQGEHQTPGKKQKVEGTVSCSQCPKKFQNEQALSQHINSKHADKKQ